MHNLDRMVYACGCSVFLISGSGKGFHSPVNFAG